MKIVVWLTHPSIDCWQLGDEQAERLDAALPEAEISVERDVDGFLRELADAEIAIVWRFEQSWFKRAPHLRWIVTPAAGRDYFQVTPPDNVRLTYGTFHGELIGETVLAFLLAHYRGAISASRLQSRLSWPRAEVAKGMRSLRGTHIVILGFGNIGRWAGRLAKPFGVRITGVSRGVTKEPEYFDDEDRCVAARSASELDAALQDADSLVIALPRSTSTDNLIDKDRLAALPKGAILINIGRGNCIVEGALCDALGSDHLAAAYLDVFQEEPLPENSPLRSLPNALLMPHASAVAPNYLDLFIDEFVRELRLKELR